MDPYPKPLRALISTLKRLPGIGGKSAQRLAFHVLRTPVSYTHLTLPTIYPV